MVNTNSILISVIIPVYNYARFVGQAIDSVLTQTFNDIEILIIDDGSIDNSREIILGYSDNRIKYFYKENSGPSSSRNFGLEKCNGDFIAFLDADDIWLKDKLEKQVHVFEKSPEIGLCYGGYYVINDIGNITATRVPRKVGENYIGELILDNYVSGSSSTSMIRKECINRVGYFDETLTRCEDWDMWLRIAKYYKLSAIKEPISMIRVHPGSLTTNPLKMDQGARKVIEKFYSQPSLPFTIEKLKKRALSNSKISAARFALRSHKNELVIKFCLESLAFCPFQIEPFIILRDLLISKIDDQKLNQ